MVELDHAICRRVEPIVAVAELQRNMKGEGAKCRTDTGDSGEGRAAWASRASIQAILLGFLEGFTEFIPVSSTGHILLCRAFPRFSLGAGKTFEVVIQLGAVLAVLSVYFGRLWRVAMALPSDPAARRFVIAILVAFLPAAVIGALAHDFIKTVLFETPSLICVMLILGGIALFFIDRLDLQTRLHTKRCAIRPVWR